MCLTTLLHVHVGVDSCTHRVAILVSFLYVQCHWSEEPEDPEKVRRAHSKYIRGPMNFYGHEADVDVMIEAKSKEMTLLDFRQYAQHDIELPGAADEHDGKIYDRITQEKEDLKQLKVKEEQVQELQAAAAPFL